MCHEWRARQVRAQAREEEGRRFWDLFDRETRDEPPRPVVESEPPPREDPDPVVASERVVTPR
jgi:hypothetical protein